ncbi:MAG: tetratricopeptide repeat protein [Myxococcota bacterium]|nr:tetratricopeptide repeat protein [Myxococcota bacterium]
MIRAAKSGSPLPGVGADTTEGQGETGARRQCFAAVFFFALAVRTLELVELADTPLFEFVLGDAKNYVAWGREIGAGNWIGDETFYQAPLYPYFLGVVFWWFGDDLFAVRVVQIVVGAASCGLIALAGWHWFSRAAGWCAGLLFALYGPAVYADAMLQKSVLDLFFMSLALWWMARVHVHPSAKAALGLGVAVGFMALTRENALVFPAVLLPWLLLGLGEARGASLRLAVTFVLGMSLVLVPVAIRNQVVGGEFHLTTSQFGHNFYIGNNPAADGTYKPLTEGKGDPRIERLDAIEIAERAMGRSLTPAEVSAFYTDRALEYIASDPLDWLALLGRKLLLVFTSVEVVDTEDQYTHAESSHVLAVTGTVFHFGVVAPLAVLGIGISWGRRRELIPLYGMFAIYTSTLILFYLFARYRLPLVPILFLFAGVALEGARRFATERNRPRFETTLALTAAVALGCNWPVFEKDYMRSVTHYNLGNELFAVGREAEAVLEFRTAVELHPRNAFALHNLGALRARAGDMSGAEDYYRRALEVNPGYGIALSNLARTLRDSGEPARIPEAISLFERAIERSPYDADLHNELGEMHAMRGTWAAAIEHFGRALSIVPSHAQARENLDRARQRASGKP